MRKQDTQDMGVKDAITELFESATAVAELGVRFNCDGNRIELVDNERTLAILELDAHGELVACTLHRGPSGER